jgi:hypothetical protein
MMASFHRQLARAAGRSADVFRGVHSEVCQPAPIRLLSSCRIRGSGGNQPHPLAESEGKYLPGEIVKIMKQEGWSRFNMSAHTNLWKALDAQNPAKGYGTVSLGGRWGWYETWLNRVREECQQNPPKYRL